MGATSSRDQSTNNSKTYIVNDKLILCNLRENGKIANREYTDGRFDTKFPQYFYITTALTTSFKFIFETHYTSKLNEFIEQFHPTHKNIKVLHPNSGFTTNYEFELNKKQSQLYNDHSRTISRLNDYGNKACLKDNMVFHITFQTCRDEINKEDYIESTVKCVHNVRIVGWTKCYATSTFEETLMSTTKLPKVTPLPILM